MKKLLFFGAAALLTLASGCSQREDATVKKATEIYKGIKEVLAPDWRSKTFEFKIDKDASGNYVVYGATTEQKCKDSLISALEQNGIEVLDSMKMLPDSRLEGKIYGVAAQSVINFRTSGKYSAESATQVLMGTPVKILEKQGGWTRAITPEGYISWVTSSSLAEMNEQEFEKYKSADKVIITDKYVTIVAEPSAKAQMVSDGVIGDILLDLGTHGGWQKVSIADGREGYLSKKSVEKFDKWLESRNPTPENIIATAKQFIGVPYMWGGTSLKAVDCSGFTKSTYYLNGIVLARDASQQCLTGDNIDISKYVNGNEYTLDALSNLKTGDLIFFGRKATAESKERITHVGIYIGEGIFIHSAGKVRINSLIPEDPAYYDGSKSLVRAQRILGNVDSGKGIFSIKKLYN